MKTDVRVAGDPVQAADAPLVVAMFTDSYLPRISGVVHSVQQFSAELRARGHRVLILAPATRGFADADPDVIRLPSFTTPMEPTFPLAVPLRRRLFRDLAGHGVDVVHAHSPFIMGRLALYAARRLRRPLVFTHHTLYHEYVHYVPWVRRALSQRAVLAYTRSFANRCDVVLAATPIIERLLRESGVVAPIALLPSAGIDSAEVAALRSDGVRERHGIPRDATLLVTVSRLAPEKTVDLVLRAFQQVQEGAEAYLLIVGDGPSAGPLQELAAELGVARRVRFAGGQPHLRALEAMAAADVFVFGSQTEVQGVVLLEAMAVGVPIVAVARGGTLGVLRDGETAVLVDPDAGALAAAVLDLLRDERRMAGMRQRAREVVKPYAIPVLTDRLVALYRSVLARTRTALPQRT